METPVSQDPSFPLQVFGILCGVRAKRRNKCAFHAAVSASLDATSPYLHAVVRPQPLCASIMHRNAVLRRGARLECLERIHAIMNATDPTRIQSGCFWGLAWSIRPVVSETQPSTISRGSVSSRLRLYERLGASWS